MSDSKSIAKQFHDVYELLAPDFGYETRQDTKNFDPDSPNGKLMIAVCNEVLGSLDKQIAELKQNCAFYKCCALSGETPKEGSEPFPEAEKSELVKTFERILEETDLSPRGL